jgi:hypothetical protein
MKHLKKRDNYLQQLNERRKLESLNDNQFINEAFKNEIKWGDSLLGKLVNWVIRKIGIGAKLLKMPAVVNALKEQFDNLIATSSYSDVSKDQQIKITEIQISEILKALANAVESGEEVKVLIEMTTDVIEQLESLKVVKESEEKKKDILERLEKFLEFLNSLKQEETESDSESSEEVPQSGKLTWSNSYSTVIKNLTSLQLLLTNYKGVKLVDTSKSKKQQITYVVKAGDTLEKIQKDTAVNKDKLTLDEIKKINSQVLSKYIESAKKMNTIVDKINLAIGTKIILSRPTATGTSESLIYEADVAYTTQQLKSQTGNPVGGNVTSGESHATQAFKKLLVSIQTLENPKEKGYAVTSQFIMDILNNKKEGKSTIKNLYREILRFLIGDKKATLNAPVDPLYKESFQTISDKNKVVVVAEKIARFSKRALQFDGENLYGSYGNLATPLKDFVESLKSLMKIDPKELTMEKKQESQVFRYDRFIRLIKEADETTSDEIKKYFNENLDIDAFLIEENEVRKIEQELEDKAKSPKELVIRGMNPIIEIIRIFNRAYKIHTTAVIPVGTTDGTVNAQTWAEYTAFGYSSGEPSATTDGPYRNNKVFNQWEQGVFDILADTKYAPIFAVGTKVDDGSGNIKEGAGVALRQLMLDLLDGNELYKGDGDGGAQKAALNKYFGDVSKDFFEDEPKEGYLSYKGPDGKQDLSVITENANKIKTSKIKFTSAKNISESLKDNKFRGTIFCVSGKNQKGQIDNLYVYVYSGKGANYFALVSETLFDLRKILIKYQPSLTLDKGDLVTIDLLEKNSAGVIPLMSTMISASTLQKLKDGSVKSLTVNSLFKDKDGKEQTNSIKLTEVKQPSFVVKELDEKGAVEVFRASDEKNNNEVLKGIKSMLTNISVIETTGYGDDKKFKAHTTAV